jgi:hypothetical protein
VACSTRGRDEKCIKTWVRKTERKRLLGRPRRGEEDNIRMDVWKIGWEGVNRIYLAYDREHWWDVVNTVMNHRVP